MNEQVAENPFKLAPRWCRRGGHPQYSGSNHRFYSLDCYGFQCPNDLGSIPHSERKKQKGRRVMRKLRTKALIVHEATAALHVVIPGVLLVGITDLILKLQGVI